MDEGQSCVLNLKNLNSQPYFLPAKPQHYPVNPSRKKSRDSNRLEPYKYALIIRNSEVLGSPRWCTARPRVHRWRGVAGAFPETSAVCGTYV